VTEEGASLWVRRANVKPASVLQPELVIDKIFVKVDILVEGVIQLLGFDKARDNAHRRAARVRPQRISVPGP
jgi:hypothetical protein